MWHGDVAYSSWDDTKFDYEYFIWVGAWAPIEFAAGGVVPMTLLWADGGGPGNAGFDITTPDGTTYTDTTGFFLGASCQGVDPFTP